MIHLARAIIRIVTHRGPATLTTRDCWLLCPDGDTRGHVPGDWDCPCGPFVTTDVEAGLRIVRHVALRGMSGESGRVER